jgi:hypothetical protein
MRCCHHGMVVPVTHCILYLYKEHKKIQAWCIAECRENVNEITYTKGSFWFGLVLRINIIKRMISIIVLLCLFNIQLTSSFLFLRPVVVTRTTVTTTTKTNSCLVTVDTYLYCHRIVPKVSHQRQTKTNTGLRHCRSRSHRVPSNMVNDVVPMEHPPLLKTTAGTISPVGTVNRRKYIVATVLSLVLVSSSSSSVAETATGLDEGTTSQTKNVGDLSFQLKPATIDRPQIPLPTSTGTATTTTTATAPINSNKYKNPMSTATATTNTNDSIGNDYAIVEGLLYLKNPKLSSARPGTNEQIIITVQLLSSSSSSSSTVAEDRDDDNENELSGGVGVVAAAKIDPASRITYPFKFRLTEKNVVGMVPRTANTTNQQQQQQRQQQQQPIDSWNELCATKDLVIQAVVCSSFHTESMDDEIISQGTTAVPLKKSLQVTTLSEPLSQQQQQISDKDISATTTTDRNRFLCSSSSSGKGDGGTRSTAIVMKAVGVSKLIMLPPDDTATTTKKNNFIRLPASLALEYVDP